ncbi:MAG: hypothetical protein H0X24_22980 [Ktedonobacterales bacterium]|nr:hypothetical protein [Ktedonobacterales bacterium]
MFAAIWLCLGGIVLVLGVLGMAALRWGVSSLDGPDSPEWERRQHWYGGHLRANHSNHSE